MYGVVDGGWMKVESGSSQSASDVEADGRGTDSTAARWFAVWTKSRQEKISATMIESQGIQNFLPLQTELRQWSDRRQAVTVPLFSGYLFVKLSLVDGSRLRVLQVPGVVGLVGNGNGPQPIPDHEIEAVRTVVAQRMECTVHPLLEQGDRVRVMRGALAGMEGLLVRMNSSSRLVISINMIHSSLAVCVDERDVERVEDRVDMTQRERPFGGLHIPMPAAG
jgi:transcription antitermination factor NusG